MRPVFFVEHRSEHITRLGENELVREIAGTADHQNDVAEVFQVVELRHVLDEVGLVTQHAHVTLTRLTTGTGRRRRTVRGSTAAATRGRPYRRLYNDQVTNTSFMVGQTDIYSHRLLSAMNCNF